MRVSKYSTEWINMYISQLTGTLTYIVHGRTFSPLSLSLSLSLSPSLSLNLDYYRSAVFDSFVSEDIFRYTNSHQNQIKIKQKIFSCSITTSIDIDPSKHFTTKHIKANNASFNGVFVIVYFVVRFWRKTQFLAEVGWWMGLDSIYLENHITCIYVTALPPESKMIPRAIKIQNVIKQYSFHHSVITVSTVCKWCKI